MGINEISIYQIEFQIRIVNLVIGKEIGNYMKLYTKIANTCQARKNCLMSANNEWFDRHTETLRELEKLLPSGSGIDNGTKIDEINSYRNKIVLIVPFHPMDDNGYYVNWVEYKIIITPTFGGMDIIVQGRDKHNLADYLGDLFHRANIEYENDPPKE